MPTLRTTRNLLIAALCIAPLAHAATPGCEISSNTLDCKLQNFLSFLYGIAGVLSVILVIVIAVATLIYRKNKNSRDLP